MVWVIISVERDIRSDLCAILFSLKKRYAARQNNIDLHDGPSTSTQVRTRMLNKY